MRHLDGPMILFGADTLTMIRLEAPIRPIEPRPPAPREPLAAELSRDALQQFRILYLILGFHAGDIFSEASNLAVRKALAQHVLQTGNQMDQLAALPCNALMSCVQTADVLAGGTVRQKPPAERA